MAPRGRKSPSKGKSRKAITSSGRDFAEEILQQFELQKTLPPGTLADYRIPAQTDEMIAKLYGGEDPFTPANFSVPGVDAPSAKLQLWVDKERPFTTRFNCLDPQTGITKSSKLSAQPKECAAEWLTIFTFAYQGISKEAEKLRKEKDVTAAVAYLRKQMPELAKIYKNVSLLARNPALSAANKNKATAILRKIETYLTVEADLQLAGRIQRMQRGAFDDALSLLTGATPSALTNSEKAVLASTLLKIANDNPELSVQKAQIIQLQTQLKDDSTKAVDAAVTRLSPFIDDYWPTTPTIGQKMDYEKMVLIRDYTLRQLVSPKNSIKIDLPMSKFNAAEKARISQLVSVIIDIKNQDPAVDVKEVAKRIREKYSDAKPRLDLGYGAFDTTQDRTILARFSDLTDARSNFNAVSKDYLKPVCETFQPTDVKKFLDLYVVYHELMMLYLIFYYTGCSDEFDKDKDISNLADDWFRWLRGNPFHVNVKKSSREMNIDEFNMLAPQNFFGLLLPNPATKGNPANFGFKTSTETFTIYRNGFAELQNLAEQIQSACVAVGNKLTDYSKNMKFLATVVTNFAPVFEAISTGSAIQWEKLPDGRVVRRPNPSAIAKCEYRLYDIDNQFNPGASFGPAPDAAAAAAAGTPPPATNAPPAVPPPAPRVIPNRVKVTLKNRFPDDAASYAVDLANDPNDAILQKFVQVDADTIQTAVPYIIDPAVDKPFQIVADSYNFISKNATKPMYIWFDGEPDPILPDSLAGKNFLEYEASAYGQTPWIDILQATPLDKLVNGDELVLQIANKRA